MRILQYCLAVTVSLFLFGTTPLAHAATACDYCTDVGRACNITTLACIPCTTTIGCTEQQQCNANTGYCDPKSLFHPFVWNDGVLIPLVFLAAAINNAGGTGGGTIYISLLSLLGGFRVKDASANSHALIFAGMLANVFFNLGQRHVKRNAPRIDWNLVSSTVPFFLAGSTVGVLLNQLFPNFFLSFLLAAIMFVLIILFLAMGIRMALHEIQRSRQEREMGLMKESSVGIDAKCGESRALSESTKQTGGGEVVLKPSRTGQGCAPPVHPIGRRIDPLLHAENLEEMLEIERPWFQWRYMLFLISCWSVLFVARYLSGSPEVRSPVGLPLCQAGYWLLFAAQETYLLSVGIFMIFRNRRLQRLRDQFMYPWYIDENGMGDLRWGPKFLYGYPAWAFLAGILDTWTGISGSALLIPFLYLLGHVDPYTVQSSVSSVILVTSSAGAISFLAYGLLLIDYSLFYGLFALLGSYAGVVAVYAFSKQMHAKAIFILILALAFSFSLGTLLYLGIRNTLAVVAAGVGWKFTNICAPAYS